MTSTRRMPRRRSLRPRRGRSDSTGCSRRCAIWISSRGIPSCKRAHSATSREASRRTQPPGSVVARSTALWRVPSTIRDTAEPPPIRTKDSLLWKRPRTSYSRRMSHPSSPACKQQSGASCRPTSRFPAGIRAVRPRRSPVRFWIICARPSASTDSSSPMRSSWRGRRRPPRKGPLLPPR